MKSTTRLLLLLICRCVVGALLGSPMAHAQDATVTFYSHGSIWTSGIPGTKHDVYLGGIFDGKQELFWFHDRFFAHNNRYLTLHLPPGPHSFGASNGKRPEAREMLDVVLEAGNIYFIRAQGESAGVPGVFEIQHGRLDLMTCAEAQTELEKAKMLKDKSLSKYTRAHQATLVVMRQARPPVSNDSYRISMQSP